MKIALIGDSPLIDKSLEMLLREYLTSYKQCDFIVATKPMENANKPIFLIGDFENANLKKPFTKEILLQKLESFYAKVSNQEDKEAKANFKPLEEFLHNDFKEIPKKETSLNATNIDSSLEAEVQELFSRYAKELEQIFKNHYNG